MDETPQKTLPDALESEQITFRRWLIGAVDRLILAVWLPFNRKKVEAYQRHVEEEARKALLRAHLELDEACRRIADRSGVQLTEVRRWAVANMKPEAREKYFQIQAYLDKLAKENRVDG